MVKLSFHCKRLLLSRAFHNECGFVFVEKVLTLVLNLTHDSINPFMQFCHHKHFNSYGYVLSVCYVCMRRPMLTQLLTSWHIHINQNFYT